MNKHIPYYKTFVNDLYSNNLNVKNKQFPCDIINENYCNYFELGSKAPNFTLKGIINGMLKDISLSDYIGKWILLFFYGSDFTFV